MRVAERLARKVRADFRDEAQQVIDLLEETAVKTDHGQSNERITGAAVVLARGDTDRFLIALQLMEEDWRDLLVSSGLADEGWEDRLEAYFAS
ncbi:hypothetical protein [Streptomyces sp. HNM0574]|uniref:hypothetical protein n=1 Tax=Streptomyces sp. HNM0574 TaxID=2714954 RepID=UPI00146C4AD2|nr:hypothetical protein [Streptomyces sp. HNM0574]NLU67175.1 hypothetical protein [Streptomyces sp. HNM0574]